MAIDKPIDAAEPYLKESSDVPLGLTLLATGVAFPYATPLLGFVALVSAHLSTKERQGRAQLFLDLLRDQQGLLEQLGNNYDKLKINVEDLAEAVQVAVFRDAEAFNDNKRDRYLKILGNAVRSEDQISDLASFIHDVEVLGDRDVEVLKVLNRVMNKPGDMGLAVAGKINPGTLIGRRDELAKETFRALNPKAQLNTLDGKPFNHEEGYATCARLQGFGLAHEIDLSTSHEVPIGEYCFRTSTRGLMLLKLIGEEVPNWRHYFPAEQTPR